MSANDLIKVPNSLWHALKSIPIKRAAILQRAKLPASVVTQERKINTEQLFDLWDALESIVGPDIGLELTKTVNVTTLPPSFLVAYHAKDVGEALYRVARFIGLSTCVDVRIAIDGDDCCVTCNWPHAKRAEPNALTDSTYSFLVNMVRVGTGQRITPRCMDLCRSQSTDIQDWFDCPINWNAQEARLVFDRKDLSISFVSYNRELVEMLDAVLDADLQQSKQSKSLTEQVRWHLKRALAAGQPGLRSIARDLAISERSLQRHLKDEGQSFKSLLSDTRHLLACEYLSEKDRDIREVAYLLGYDNQRSFFRAFRKWERKTPTEWRSALVSGPEKVPIDH
ncbi:helix-turn-helix domain-containing protein [Roseibium sp. HPY-6]|uniref:AraC family transcriptional regulator n=1 Tax=Roseibium sp. HPY-6 TaxID=3229852 RepID=UPI00338E17C3